MSGKNIVAFNIRPKTRVWVLKRCTKPRPFLGNLQFMYLSIAPLSTRQEQKKAGHGRERDSVTRSKKSKHRAHESIFSQVHTRKYSSFFFWQKSVCSQCTRMEWNNETHITKSIGSCPELCILSGSSGQR